MESTEWNRKREMGKPKAVIVGGSIAGICCAHALIRAGWDVLVIEKTPQPPRGSPTGAGLGLDPFSQKIIESWIQLPQLLQETTLSLVIDQGNSLTMKVSNNLVQSMHEEAEKTWVPELVRVIKEIKEPFLNVIYDCDPLEQIFWDKVVLIGDAAHPTTPHGLRSTNMSILDAAVLGKCLEKWQVENLNSALEEYQSIRLPVTMKQVLYSRRLGRIKQGLSLSDCPSFDPTTASPDDCEELQQKNMPHFYDIPSLLK